MPFADLKVDQCPIGRLRAARNNARVHSRRQIGKLSDGIKALGFNNPILITDDYEIIAGHGRWAAAKRAGLTTVPVIKLSHLTPEQQRLYRLADNKIALDADWDQPTLAIELDEILKLDLDATFTGFSMPEIDILLSAAAEADPHGASDSHNAIPVVSDRPVSRRGDVWNLGNHRLICGDARDPEVFAALLQGARASQIIADVPYNTPVHEWIAGARGSKHRAFEMAGGDMPPDEYREFLTRVLRHTAAHSAPGAVAYVFIDWRHVDDLSAAGRDAFHELMNIIVWNKTNAGMGNFYRSKHELIFAFKASPGRHQNNFNLGETGRYRTNVWDYAGVASFGGNDNRRLDDLSLHPTTKPVRMIADAIKDTSSRGEIVLDPFGGAGTTLIAAEQTGRRARLIEIDPRYCDVILQRFREQTGREPTLQSSGMTLDEVAIERLGDTCGE